ncbi:hypothetical protein [Cereibacter johrii]|uniref:Cell pole-organizing protein PopZ n=1 Tax=Cereibacter johrii TaxID=445629 RepID=A0ABX5JCW3_9RHOB|nr:hypothetical protein [Cereibacter johrii]ODM41448.1 hypothetical protein A9O63_15415 [Cereibacter johrii]ODM41912.1 hypothetical protein A9O63_01205 [Cereibacter johrii]PTM80496.1 hypothetical protein C8J29_102578 [Cereibacter johrii]
MTERMTNVEYGDVLSSIRRLVAEGAGGEPLPVGPDPLVLTPALRVVTPADPVPPAPFMEAEEDWLPESDPETGAPFIRPATVVSLAGGAARVDLTAPHASPAEPDGMEKAGSPAAPEAEPAADPVPQDPRAGRSAAGEEARQQQEAATADRETRLPVSAAARAPAASEGALDLEDDRLRAMVQAVIREELQGELGERITRNIRKLIRAEIHRALLARDSS